MSLQLVIMALGALSLDLWIAVIIHRAGQVKGYEKACEEHSEDLETIKGHALKLVFRYKNLKKENEWLKRENKRLERVNEKLRGRRMR